VLFLEQVAQQGGFAGAEKAAEDGDGDRCEQKKDLDSLKKNRSEVAGDSKCQSVQRRLN
jgi:hypothetical protein